MAILEDLGLEVNIVVNDSPLQEYEDEEDDPIDDGFSDDIRKCRRYVQVDGDAEFGVQICIRPNNNYLDDEMNEKVLKFKVDLDGQDDLVCLHARTKDRQPLIEGEDEFDGHTRVSVRKFRFTTVSIVEDDDKERLERDKKTAEPLGLIRVRVWRARLSDQTPPVWSAPNTGFDETDDQLAEKALKGKALSHRATLSAAVPARGLTLSMAEYVDRKKTPLAIFYFQYRSRAVLQDELVIPRSREPSPQEFGLDGLALGEVRRLARESLDDLPLHELRKLAQLRLSSTKEENDTSSKGDVKREPGDDQISPRPRKIVRMSDGREAIDLSGDD